MRLGCACTKCCAWHRRRLWRESADRRVCLPIGAPRPRTVPCAAPSAAHCQDCTTSASASDGG
eukprot:3705965-Pleurochrysis_carterae.AAC.1